MRRPSWIDIIEAIYDMDAREQQWLRRVVCASEPVLDVGLGVVAYTYDVSHADRVRVPASASSPGLRVFTRAFLVKGMQEMGAKYLRATFRSIQVETSSRTPGYEESGTESKLQSVGVGDMLGINGLDPSGVGVWLGAALPRRTTLRRAERARCERVATHLGAAYRLRRRLRARPGARKTSGPAHAVDTADAVLSPSGKLEHAASDDVAAAREQLRAAAVAIDRARGKQRHIDPDSALAGWAGLVDGRWTLVDQFDRDGKRFVLARRNEPSVRGVEMLTQRERAVAGYAAVGHSNKHIAYDLGIAHSTVRVLLARAASKLGVRSREELVAAVRAAVDARR